MNHQIYPEHAELLGQAVGFMLATLECAMKDCTLSLTVPSTLHLESLYLELLRNGPEEQLIDHTLF